MFTFTLSLLLILCTMTQIITTVVFVFPCSDWIFVSWWCFLVVSLAFCVNKLSLSLFLSLNHKWIWMGHFAWCKPDLLFLIDVKHKNQINLKRKKNVCCLHNILPWVTNFKWREKHVCVCVFQVLRCNLLPGFGLSRLLGIHSTVFRMEEEMTDTNSQTLSHLNDCDATEHKAFQPERRRERKKV